MDGDADDGERECPQEAAHQRLAQHTTGTLKVVGADEVGYLNGES